MNILYILQQSVYNNENKWISADSNIQMCCGILRELLEKTNWNFYILIAPIKDFADIKSYDELLEKNERIHWIEYNFPIDAFFLRQHFSMFDFQKMWSNLPKINVVWNNIIELSRNIKTFLWYKSKETKLISCCYWMDTPEINEPKVDKEISYQWRQFDGYECSDLCAFTCESTRKAFFDNAEKFIDIIQTDYLCKIYDKSKIWDFGFSTKEADKYFTNEKFNKKTIVFANRLSGINYTHHEEFIQAVNELYEKRQDFQVVFTNPSGKYSWEKLKQLVKPLYIYKEHSLSRKEYFELLWKADISVHLYGMGNSGAERYGGCFHRESVYCNNIIITPKIFEYMKIQGDDYLFYIKRDFSDFINKLNLALDIAYFNNDRIKNRNLNSSFEKISNNIIKDIEGLVNDSWKI